MTVYNKKNKVKLQFDGNCFSHTNLGFYPHEKSTKKILKSDKMISFTTNGKLSLKCVCFDGIVVDGVRCPILSSFALKFGLGHR